MINTKIKILIFVAITLLVGTLAISAYATDGELTGEFGDLDSEFLQATGLGTKASIAIIVSEVIKIFLSFLGIIFVILIIYAGFMWLTSTGNDEKISKSKKIISAAFIGLAIVLAAYSITYFVIDKMLEATTGRTGLDRGF